MKPVARAFEKGFSDISGYCQAVNQGPGGPGGPPGRGIHGRFGGN